MGRGGTGVGRGGDGMGGVGGSAVDGGGAAGGGGVVRGGSLGGGAGGGAVAGAGGARGGDAPRPPQGPQGAVPWGADALSRGARGAGATVRLSRRAVATAAGQADAGRRDAAAARRADWRTLRAS